MKRGTFILLFFVFLSNASFSQWEMQMPKPTASDFIDVAVLSSDVAIVVGQKQMFRTTDAGETYLPVELNHSEPFSSVYSTDNPDVVWLSSGRGQVFRSTDMGNSWYEVKNADDVEFSTFYALNEIKSWVAESNGLLLVTTDAGNDWDTITSGLGFGLTKLHFVNDTLGFATPYYEDKGSDDYSDFLLRTVDGGSHWDTIAVISDSKILLVESFGQTTVWYVDKEHLHTSYDAGNTWSETALPVQKAEYSMSLAATSPTSFDLLLHYNFDWSTVSALYSTQDGGVNWEEEYSSFVTGVGPPSFDPIFLKALDAKSGTSYMVGSYSHILVKKDESDWVKMSKNILGNVWDMTFVDKNNGFGIGYGPFLLKTHDAGKTWESDKVFPDSVRNNYKVWFSDLTTGYVMDFEKGLYKTIDGGNTWRNVLSEGDSYYSDLFFINNTVGWVLQSDGSIYKTNDAGETWSKIITLEPANRKWLTLLFEDENTGFATFNCNNITQESGGIVKITDGSIVSKSDIENHTTVNKMVRSGDGTLWTACSRGIIYKSVDNGESWQAIDQVLGNGGHPVLDIFFTTPLKGYALCDLYGLYMTEDGGENWSLDSLCPLNNFMDLSGLAFNGSDLFVYADKAIAKNSGIVGVDELQATEPEELTVWPNPANSRITVGSTGVITKITVFDVQGRKVIAVNPQTKQCILNVGNLPLGVYFIEAVTVSGAINSRFVKN